MHATMRAEGSGRSGRGISGTFYPSGSGGPSMGAAIPKLIAVLVAIGVVRSVVGAKRHHGEGSRWNRRREAIAQLHRELHAADAAGETET
ncbi:MAG TPA: hypothetical protein VI277_04435 [Candidatus Limnocylindria bacterium]